MNITFNLAVATRTMSNQDLMQHFEELRDLYSLLKDAHRAKSFGNVGAYLKTVSQPIDRLTPQPGIGPSSISEAEEFFRTGTSARLQDLREKTVDIRHIITLFRGIHGIGPETAMKLYNKGYRTLEDLATAPLTAAQQIGLRHYEDLTKKIPRAEMRAYKNRIKQLIPTIKCKIVGSYRRREPQSSDIDLICRFDDLPSIIDQLGPLLVDTLAFGNRKYMGISRLDPTLPYRRIDVRVFSEREWAFALLYNTGSAQLNIRMRERAQELNMRLNEYTLIGADCEITHERDIFACLKMDYLHPEER